MRTGYPIGSTESSEKGLLWRAQKPAAATGCPIDFEQATFNNGAQNAIQSNNMKRHWLSLKSVIALAAGFAVIYALAILFELPMPWIIGLFLPSIIALVWMVIRILKDPYSTDKTFDEYFHQDREDIRRNGME